MIFGMLPLPLDAYDTSVSSNAGPGSICQRSRYKFYLEIWTFRFYKWHFECDLVFEVYIGLLTLIMNDDQSYKSYLINFRNTSNIRFQILLNETLNISYNIYKYMRLSLCLYVFMWIFLQYIYAYSHVSVSVSVHVCAHVYVYACVFLFSIIEEFRKLIY